MQRGYSERLQAIQRQQSLALNQLQQASISRAESFLGAAELLSQAAAAASMPAPTGLPPLAFGNAGSYDHALNSPMTPQPQVCAAYCAAVVKQAACISFAHELHCMQGIPTCKTPSRMRSWLYQ